MIVIDGSFGVGGGQILRSALLLSALTGEPFQLGRFSSERQQGLVPYKAIIEVMSQICGVKVNPDLPKPKKFIFSPKHKAKAGEYDFSRYHGEELTSLAQIVFFALSQAGEDSTVHLDVNSHKENRPTPEYLQYVFLRNISRFGFKGELIFS